MSDIENKIRLVAQNYTDLLQKNIQERAIEMTNDDKSHYLIYRLLGISDSEGEKIDLYQNTGRFLYRYAGSFLEHATKLCFEAKFPEAHALRIPNTLGTRPKTFEIDCLIENNAYEIKWRDATTDGDHILKEYARLKAIVMAGYIPIRIMYYYPNRTQAIKIQSALEDLYKANGGAYYHGDSAWIYIHDKTEIDLLSILKKLAHEKHYG
jgi:hypothetical protein